MCRSVRVVSGLVRRVPLKPDLSTVRLKADPTGCPSRLLRVAPGLHIYASTLDNFTTHEGERLG